MINSEPFVLFYILFPEIHDHSFTYLVIGYGMAMWISPKNGA
jgi:hypothetical protein